MNNEEKVSINRMKLFARSSDLSIVTAKDMEIVLNLIEKQAKEIEDLKGNNIAISKGSYFAGVCNERDEWYKKIYEKIEDLEQEKKADGLDYDWLRDTMISTLKELIGKDN